MTRPTLPTLGALLVLTSAATASTSIVIDGDFNDWRGTAPTIVDAVDAEDQFVDLGVIRVAHDLQFVHLMVDFRRSVNIQGLDGMVTLLLDVDGDPATGAARRGFDGVDVVIELSPRDPDDPDEPGRGVAVRTPTGTPVEWTADGPTAYDLGWIAAPTHADRRFECRLARGDIVQGMPHFFFGTSFRGMLVAHAASGATIDQTGVFSYEFRNSRPNPAILQPVDPFARPEGTALRFVNWNVLFGTIFKDPEPYRRVLQAIGPDIITLQELTDKRSAADLASLLNGMLPRDAAEWNVVQGDGGGNLRCAVASTLPIEPEPMLALIDDPTRSGKHLRVAAARVTSDGRRLLMLSIHLTCCGRAGDRRDRARIAEAEAIIARLHEVLDRERYDAVVIAGDYNLVGSRIPLERLVDGVLRNGREMAIAPTMQLDGRSNVTWQDADLPFGPGRLDYIIYNEPQLECISAIALETGDLQTRWLAPHGLQPNDTEQASDHLPLIVDFGWGHGQSGLRRDDDR